MNVRYKYRCKSCGVYFTKESREVSKSVEKVLKEDFSTLQWKTEHDCEDGFTGIAEIVGYIVVPSACLT